MKALVVKDYQSNYTDPWSIKEGEQLKIGARESEWDGWVWCTNSAGESRWVPERFLQRQGDKGIALRDYEATELSVMSGEQVVMGYEESGWTWCVKISVRAAQTIRQGWVPLACLDVTRNKHT